MKLNNVIVRLGWAVSVLAVELLTWGWIALSGFVMFRISSLDWWPVFCVGWLVLTFPLLVALVYAAKKCRHRQDQRRFSPPNDDD